jgi:small subunit ribosomal protein S16
VAVKIKLKRLGKIRAPYYRIVVADARTKRDGRAIEEIGKYHPKAEPSLIEVDSDRAQHWLSVGAQPTDPVRKILEITGDWQRFKGLPGTEGTLKTAAPREDRKEIFAAAVKETLGDVTAAPKGRARSAGRDSESAARSGAGRDSESAAKGGRASAAAGKTDKPAKAKAGEASEEAKASANDAKAGDATAGDAQAGDAKAGDAKAGAAKAGGGRGGTAKGAAKTADAADAPAEAPATTETAGSESASGD